MLDGEKAQRTDVTRRLTELAKQAARLQRLDPPDEGAAGEVHRERTALEQRKLQHSAQVHERMGMPCKAVDGEVATGTPAIKHVRYPLSGSWTSTAPNHSCAGLAE